MQMFSKGKMNFLKLPENVSIATPLEIFFGCLQLRKISLILLLVNSSCYLAVFLPVTGLRSLHVSFLT